MYYTGFKGNNSDLSTLGLHNATVHWNLNASELVERTLKLGQGTLTSAGALAIDTGKFTGRSPEDRFIVKDDITSETVDWGKVNKPFDADKFDALYNKVVSYLNTREIYARDCQACTKAEYSLNVRVITQFPWQNLFANNMFIRLEQNELEDFTPDWTVISAPGFMADAEIDGTRQENFAVVNFTRKTIIIGGTAYTGEIKKGIFSVLNFELPTYQKVLSMHCSANVGVENNDTAVFFGLSGTGKTTLSTDPNRQLIGDDEHGWSAENVFNFEGGCYAKCIDLSAEKEPEIYGAIKSGALVENTVYHKGTRTVNFEDVSKTQNTRVSYPIHHIDNVMPNQVGGVPENIFFLTADAFGVLPPISKLTTEQAMYHFISGYTAKVAGTELGINEPQVTFSACFGAPFLPLHPTAYAEMLGKKLEENPNINVWLINTGWTGGSYGTGNRIKLRYTRAMISAALQGKLNNVDYSNDNRFGLNVPAECVNVPTEILNPINTWADKEKYNVTAKNLAEKFSANFKQFSDKASEAILSSAPEVA
ncbi:UNVERIFIED_CONTAM: hypothetical protein GTU68_026744 [Idotea baltica]|nr:hypothetical protein [Idotea baltica]